MIHKFSRYLLTLVALFAMTTGAWAQTVTVTWTLTDLQANSDVTTFTKDGVTITCDTRMSSGKSFVGPVTISTTLGNFTKIEITGSNSAPTTADGFTNDGNVSTWTGNAASISSPASIAYATQFVFTIAPAGPTVTLNEAKTVATMAAMPASDATVDYELVRDMEVDVNAYVGTDANTTYRHRVQKVDANTYSPVGITTDAQLIALFPVIDVIDAQNPKALTYGTDYTVTIVDANLNEIAIGEFSFAPGTYTVKVTGMGDYDGQIASANSFELYYGYEVYVPAHEYVTYCSTEALTLEDENAALYTITAVSNSEATLSRALTVAPATTPLLVENNSDESRTILLIPTDKQADDVTPATEFIGVLTADRDLYKNNTFDFYAFNGLDFVLVNNLVTIPVGKCFIGIQTGNLSARSITIRRSATAIGATLVNSEEVNSEEWFDLNGRKVNKPTKKGIYIKNGQKVVIK